MSHTETVLTGYDQRRIENLTSPLLFRELVDFAVEACLSRPFEPKPYEESLSDEARLVAKLGTRGLRVALQLARSGMEPSEFVAQSEDDQRPIFEDDPMREPEYFSDEVHPELLHLASEFGQALLGEAYRTLGQDVFDKIREYRAATTVEERRAVLDWLDERLWRMNRQKRRGVAEGEDVNDTFYHPIRLSPKVIGVYPNHNFNPTCLGVSVIAASFLEQAGAEHLHAGVMETRYNDLLAQSAGVLRMLAGHAERMGITLPDPVIDSLNAKADKLFDAYTRNRGYHAASYAKVGEAAWHQLDSNYDLTEALHEVYSEGLEKTYRKLQDYTMLAPGIELMQNFEIALVPTVCCEVLEYSDETFLADAASARAFLLGDEDESIIEKIRSEFVDPFFAAKREPNGETSGFIEECIATMGNMVKDEVFENGVYNAINKYVFWGGAPRDVMDRCRVDERFLEDRIADIRALPVTVMGAYIVAAVSAIKPEMLRAEHALIEVGLPAQRIGMAVLSDFAMHCDNRLPASFWISHWPSDIPLTETMDGAARSSAQDSVLGNNAKWAAIRTLQYSNAYDMVNEFLSRRQPPPDEEE